MVYLGNAIAPPPSKIEKKRSLSLTTAIAVLCAGIISGVTPQDGTGTASASLNDEYYAASVEILPIVFPHVTEEIIQEEEVVESKQDKKERYKKLSHFLLGEYGPFLSHLFRDLRLDSGIMTNLIERESKGDTYATSVRGAKGIMQIQEVVLDDMGGIEGIKKYARVFSLIRKETVDMITYQGDKDRILLLKDLAQILSKNLSGKDRDISRGLLEEYNRVIFSLKMELYNPEINIVLGSVYMKYLEKIAKDIPDDKLEAVSAIIENLSEEDIARINELRKADKKDRISSDYDFAALDTQKIITLSMYNVGPNAKDMKSGVLYAIAIMA